MNKNNQLQLVTFEQAKQLKALGFDWPCTAYYHEGVLKDHSFKGIINRLRTRNHINKYITSKETIAAPTVALALKWIRDVKKILCSIETDFHTYIEGDMMVAKTLNRGKYIFRSIIMASSSFDTYEEAEKCLLDALLHVIKHEN